MTVKKSMQTSEGKKFVPNKKGDIGMEAYYLCQPNTYVIALPSLLLTKFTSNDIGVGLT